MSAYSQPTVSVTVKSFGGTGDDSFEKVAFVPSTTSPDIVVAAKKGNGCASFLRYSPALTLLRNIDFACPTSVSSAILESHFGFDGAGNLGYALTVQGTIRVGTQMVTRPGLYSIVGIVSNGGVVQAIRANSDYANLTEVILNKGALYVQYFDSSGLGGGELYRLLRFNANAYDQVEPEYDWHNSLAHDVEGDLSIFTLITTEVNLTYPNATLTIQRAARGGGIYYNKSFDSLISPLPYNYRRLYLMPIISSAPTNNAYASTLNWRFVLNEQNDAITNPLNLEDYAIDAAKILPGGARGWVNRIRGNDIMLHSAAISETESYFSVFSASKPIKWDPRVYTPPNGAKSYYEIIVTPSGTSRTVRRILFNSSFNEIRASALSTGNRRALVGTINSLSLRSQGFIAVY
jgi:hypothetical protein